MAAGVIKYFLRLLMHPEVPCDPTGEACYLEMIQRRCSGEPLQYLLIDGRFCGASVGHFRNGPYDLNDIVCDHPDAEQLRDEIVEAVKFVNFGKSPLRFMGKKL